MARERAESLSLSSNDFGREPEMPENRAWKEHSGIRVGSEKGFEVIECACCEFKHVVPIPSEDELQRIYNSEYYSVEKPLYIERNLEDQEWWNMVYDSRLDLFAELLSPSRKELLDIGSGPGFFLARARAKGWKGTGIEPSVEAFSHSQTLGLEVRNEFFTDELAQELGSFDVVYMNEVLEHLRDPKGALQTAAGLLRQGGLLCVVVPNDFSPFQKALVKVCGYSPWWVAPPHHINYFNLRSISRLLERIGLIVESTEATFPIDLFLLMGDNYVGNDPLGRECHAKRKALEINLEKAGLSQLKRSLYQSFADLGIGREIQIVSRKAD
jgi:SAM-dependent methyltransferase